MSLERLTAPGLSPPVGPFVHGVRAGNLVFVSGQVARGADGQTVGVGDVEAQTEQAMENLRAVLATAGASFENVAFMRIYLRNIADRERSGAVRRRMCGAALPASTLVEVSALSHPDYLIEIEAIAVL